MLHLQALEHGDLPWAGRERDGHDGDGGVEQDEEEEDGLTVHEEGGLRFFGGPYFLCPLSSSADVSLGECKQSKVRGDIQATQKMGKTIFQRETRDMKLHRTMVIALFH